MQGFFVRLVDGVQFVNGREVDVFIDLPAKTCTVVNSFSRQWLARTMFAAGQWAATPPEPCEDWDAVQFIDGFAALRLRQT